MKKISKLFLCFCIMICVVYGMNLQSFADEIAPKTSINQLVSGYNSFTAHWNKVDKKVSYQLQYSLNKKFTKKKTKSLIVKKAKVTNKTIENLKGNKKYFVRIRTYKKTKNKTYYSDWSKTKSVKVLRAVNLRKIEVTPETSELRVGQNVQLKTKLFPTKTTYREIRYTSLDEDIVKVSYNGWVTAVGSGTTHIKVSVDGTEKSKMVKINVVIPTTDIKITNPAGLSIEKNTKIDLDATVYPLNATNKKVIWKSSDKTKATVDSNGTVTALRPTEYVEITATTADKKHSATYVLKINDTTGFITKEKLDSLNLLTTNNLMIVAHPDDETFWGGAHLFNSEYLNKSEPFKSNGKFVNSNYLVVVLTNSWNKTRSADLQKIMDATNNKFLILSYPDVRKEWYDAKKQYKYEADDWTTCKTGLQKDLSLLLNYKKWDVIATHNPDGEYGKSHHKMTNNAVVEAYNQSSLNSSTPLFYFGLYYNKNDKIPGKQINSEDLEIKDKLVSMYSKNVQGAKDAFGQMFHYENWILSTKWDEVKKNKYNYEYFEKLENTTENADNK